MKQILWMFVFHQSAISPQRTNNLNLRTRWYPALDESNRWNPSISQFIRVRILLLKMVAGWLFIYLFYFIFPKHWFHILHFPNLIGLFTQPTGRHYTKYRFSPEIVTDWLIVCLWVQLRATSQPRLRAHNHCTSSTLIGGKRGASPGLLLHTMLEGPREHVNARWMWSLHGFLHGIEWVVFHGHLDCFQKATSWR